MNHSERGMANLEFIISIIIFVAIIAFVAISAFSIVPRLRAESISDDMKSKLYQMSEILMSRGYPENWTSDAVRFGLEEDEHVLSYNKLLTLNAECGTPEGYNRVRDSLGDYSFSLEITETYGKKIMECKPLLKSAGTEFSLQRAAALSTEMAKDSSVLLLHLNNEPAYGETGSSFHDFSDSGNIFSCSACPVIAGGKFRTALMFDGSDDYIIKNPFASFPPSSITAEFWIKTSDSGDGIISYAVAGNNDEFAILDSSSLKIHVKSGSINTNIAVNDNKWHFVAVSWDKNSITKIYKDGMEVYSGTLSPTVEMTPGGSMVIGQHTAAGGGFVPGQAFDGSIDEVRILGSMRTPDEIMSDFSRVAKVKLTISG